VYFNQDFPATWGVKNDMNALMVAASEGTPEAIRLILDKMLPYINQTDLNGRTALHFACAAGLSANVKELLRNPTIKRDLRTNGGNTPIMNAV
jgi:ankyrin repeat protein